MKPRDRSVALIILSPDLDGSRGSRDMSVDLLGEATVADFLLKWHATAVFS